MPAKSAKQYRLMQAIVSRKKGIGGVSLPVAREFVRNTGKKKRSLFSRGR